MKPYIDLKTADVLVNQYMDDAIKVFKENVKNSKLNNLLFEHFKKPEVVWKKRGFRVAGSYVPFFNLIKMNSNYLYSKDAERFLKETTLHELAHAINKIYFGRCHDAQWKYICKLMNRSPNIYHNYRTPENKPVRKHANFIPNL